MRALRMVLVIVVLSSLVSGCQWLCQALCGNSQQPDPKAAVFSGQVVSSTGTPLPDATVTVNGQSVTATDKGLFKLTVGSAPSYIVTIRHKGYGVFSRVYTKGVHRDRWPLYRATLTTLNPAVGGIVQDTQAANCLAARPHSGWDHLEVKGGPVSGNLRAALDSAYKPAGCNAAEVEVGPAEIEHFERHRLKLRMNLGPRSAPARHDGASSAERNACRGKLPAVSGLSKHRCLVEDERPPLDRTAAG